GRRGRDPQDARIDQRRVPIGDGPVRGDASQRDHPRDGDPQPRSHGGAGLTAEARMNERPFLLSATVDFPDDLELGIYTPHLIDQMMATLRAVGVRRVNWLDYGSATDPTSLLYNPLMVDRTYGPQSLAALGEPLPVAVKAAHRHGLQFIAVMKPFA